MDFDTLLEMNKSVIERYILFKIPVKEDAEDLIQETFLTAFEKYDFLIDKDCFKQWVLKIAGNKCCDYYRKNFRAFDKTDIELEKIPENQFGFLHRIEFTESFNRLDDMYREVLILYYINGYSQKEIADKINIPVGTVKSRLHTAKSQLKAFYPYEPRKIFIGEKLMCLPEIMPEYKIIQSHKEPFCVKWEELMGWLIIPKLNEKIKWALYDFPNKNRTEYVEMDVIGKAIVHGVEGVEIIAKEFNPVETNVIDSNSYAERKFVAQLTDTHCRFLAESHTKKGVTVFHTFLDDDEFIKNWGFGNDNCGKEINLSKKGIISCNGQEIVCETTPCMDVVGRYTVIISNKEFDTVRLMDIGSYEQGVANEQFIDKNGRTVLWRRFNADDWKQEQYGESWSEKLPDNEIIYINGKKYIHWYDCLSDYVID